MSTLEQSDHTDNMLQFSIANKPLCGFVACKNPKTLACVVHAPLGVGLQPAYSVEEYLLTRVTW